ncbi:NAD(P)H-dependent flavin oxidoreductase [Pelistega ratti]|uniref:NAD(P)H-dependent flavin oxidoreductase n=1 Tax=Pelistega ratti TaxID=2652177 RepID=UPI00135B903A|nr:nitronate monooxygenase family protein [Pelistega ratti]
MQHTIVKKLYSSMRLPVIGAPMFIVANPQLIIAQCCNGIIGSMPALNARTTEQLDEQLAQITEALSTSTAPQTAPYAINQIVHPSNSRLEKDIALCEKYKTPIIITSLSAPAEVAQAIHKWGGIVLHDVISIRHAEKALEAGVDGLILVANGAGGHAGTLNPFALTSEIRRFYHGPVALSGAISTGAGILAARAIGADFAYIGTRFIATTEANASPEYKEMLIQSSAKDITYTPYFTGVAGNYLSQSIINAGIDPNVLHQADKHKMNFGDNVHHAKAWKDIWGAGQGVGSIDHIMPTADLISQLETEYQQAKAYLSEGI